MPPTRPLKVFLCHASADKPAVRRLHDALKAEDWIDPWLDEEKLSFGQHWTTVIEDTLDAADVVLIFLSRNSVHKEGFVQRELNYAWELSLEKPRDVIFLIPFRLDDCEVPRFLRSRQWGDYFGGKEESTYQILLRSLKQRYQQKMKLEAEEQKQRESEEGLAREKVERETKEKLSRENAERDAVLKAEREKIEFEAKEKLAREKAEHDVAEKAKREKIELEAREKLTRENVEREKIARETREREVTEKEERRVKQRLVLETELWNKVQNDRSSLNFVYVIVDDGTPLYHSLPSSNNWTVWLEKDTKLAIIEPIKEVWPSIGKYGHYIEVSDSNGNKGYVSATAVGVKRPQ